ncbi:MAG: methionyl-tRNA formyltransferase [Actinobacteria bacterium]|nr:methionyl-tRNA formyltransferase [Actinomycetota bacterium]
MRVVFLGTPIEAAEALRAVHGAGHDVALVVTQPDRRRGRGSEVGPSPVKQAAEELGLPVLTPERSSEIVDDLRASGAVLGAVVAFGQLLPPAVLEALPGGYVNVHFSLLPRWRGAAPVERAILAGDSETGVALMQLEEGLDTGPVYFSERVSIGDEETAGELRHRLSTIGADLLATHIEEIPDAVPTPQDGEPSYAKKLTPEEFCLDWAEPAEVLARVVRAGNPNPGAWTAAAGRRLKILRARVGAARATASPGSLLAGPTVATGSGVLELIEVQAEGKRPGPAGEWYRGLRGVDRLGE